MPRDGNGNYTLPAGNPVVPGTLIEASWANTTMEDLAIALTNSLSRNGNGGMLAPLGFIDGAVNAPGMHFNAQVNMGLHRAALNDLRIVMDGSSVAQFTDTFVNVQVPDLQVQGSSVLTESGGTIADLTADTVTVVGDEANALDVDRPSADVASVLIRNNDGGIRISADNGNFTIHQTDATGTTQDIWIAGDQDGAVTIHYNGNSRLATTSAGISVTGDIDCSEINATVISGTSISGNTVDIDSNTEVLGSFNRSSSGASRIVVSNSEGGVSLRTDAGDFQIYQTSSGGATQDVWITGSQNGEVALRYNSSQKLATKSNGVTVSGEVAASGNVRAGVSDIRLKNISSWINPRKCLNAVSDWGVIRYTEKNTFGGADPDREQIGLVAQQIQRDFPELTPLAPFDDADGVSASGENYLTADYDRIVAVLVGAVQALQMDLEKANSDIAKLRGNLNK